MEPSSKGPLAIATVTATPTATHNGTLMNPPVSSSSHNWQFLVAVLATAISVSILIALLAKCQVVRRYLASYRHTRLREVDTISQCDTPEFAMHGGQGMNHNCIPPPRDEEDDDGFIEDNYIQASERERAERAAENMEDTEEELDEIEFTIA
ncbi:type III endosome membrane protein TEMP isoform X2 [Sphaeramia orbicularis]|uniref:type III endosome membrane protein TEMP isoform X2 n=1 Tax=Sphaeramia orbicularis TaxID=375764 RepID=UPI00117FAE6F|nr:type III endosome membrane protein TEMP isoform X2 [Sphaeramia orbicularis]